MSQKYKVHPKCDNGNLTCSGIACAVLDDGLSYFTMQAIERALRVAKTPPVSPVHLAVYDRLLGNDMVSTEIIEGEIQSVRAGYPADEDVEAVIRALSDAQRPLFYVGDGIWKSGAEARVVALAEQYGCPIAGTWTEMRRTPQSHRLHCGRQRLFN